MNEFDYQVPVAVIAMGLFMSILLFVSKDDRGKRWSLFEAIKGLIVGTVCMHGILLIFASPHPDDGRILAGVCLATLGGLLMFVVQKAPGAEKPN